MMTTAGAPDLRFQCGVSQESTILKLPGRRPERHAELSIGHVLRHNNTAHTAAVYEHGET